MVSYHEFKELVIKEMNAHISTKYKNIKIDIEQVQKNNDIILDGIYIRKSNEDLSPILYLNDFYENYKNGISLNHILYDIMISMAKANNMDSYMKKHAKEHFTQPLKKNIFIEVINKEWNNELLKNVPHKDIDGTDLTVVFRYLLSTNWDGGMSTLLIKEEMYKRLKLDMDSLYNLALKNTQRLFPVSLKKISDVINESMGIFEVPVLNDIYVLTNEQIDNGVATMLYPGILKQIGERLDSDFLIIPSSIHELIIMKINGISMDVQQVNEMICEVNEVQVSEEERLSNHAYRYHRDTNCFTIAN